MTSGTIKGEPYPSCKGTHLLRRSITFRDSWVFSLSFHPSCSGIRDHFQIPNRIKKRNGKGIMEISPSHSPYTIRRSCFAIHFPKTVSASPQNPLHQHNHNHNRSCHSHSRRPAKHTVHLRSTTCIPVAIRSGMCGPDAAWFQSDSIVSETGAPTRPAASRGWRSSVACVPPCPRCMPALRRASPCRWAHLRVQRGNH